MTRDELIETMARAMAQQIVIEIMPSFTDAPGGTAVPTVMLSGVEELPLKLLAAIEIAGLAIVPVKATDEIANAGAKALFASYNGAIIKLITENHKVIYRAMIKAGRI